MSDKADKGQRPKKAGKGTPGKKNALSRADRRDIVGLNRQMSGVTGRSYITK